MGTRSAIAIEYPNKFSRAIYCHWDGYVSHHKPILLEHYKDYKKVEELIDLGYISVLGENIGTEHDFDDCPEDVVTAYGRDRGDQFQEADLGKTWRGAVSKIGHDGYIYVFVVATNTWMFATEVEDELVPLSEVPDNT